MIIELDEQTDEYDTCSSIFNIDRDTDYYFSTLVDGIMNSCELLPAQLLEFSRWVKECTGYKTKVRKTKEGKIAALTIIDKKNRPIMSIYSISTLVVFMEYVKLKRSVK